MILVYFTFAYAYIAEHWQTVRCDEFIQFCKNTLLDWIALLFLFSCAFFWI